MHGLIFSYSGIFLIINDGESFSLKHTEVHQQYCRLIEARMESTLKNSGGQFSPTDFITIVVSRPHEPGWKDFVDTLSAVEDFGEFCKLMRQKAIESQ